MKTVKIKGCKQNKKKMESAAKLTRLVFFSYYDFSQKKNEKVKKITSSYFSCKNNSPDEFVRLPTHLVFLHQIMSFTFSV